MPTGICRTCRNQREISPLDGQCPACRENTALNIDEVDLYPKKPHVDSTEDHQALPDRYDGEHIRAFIGKINREDIAAVAKDWGGRSSRESATRSSDDI